MSDIVKRAKAALEGVTKGPWFVGNEIDGIRSGRPTVVHAPNPDFPGSLRVVTVDQTRLHFGSTQRTKGQDEANVAFIAEARSLVPELVAEIERLRARDSCCEQCGGGCNRDRGTL